MATEPTYIAALCPMDASLPPWRKVPFTTSDQSGGMVVRVGRAGTRESNSPVYRIKLKTSLANFKAAFPLRYVQAAAA